MAHASEKATNAADRAITAAQERDEKAAAYRADPLFSYLLDRGYATPAYKAGTLVRTMDGWVAQLCNYTSGRRDLQVLEQLPEHLGRHAALMEKAHQEADQAVQESLQQAMLALGGQQAKDALSAAKEALSAARNDAGAAQSELQRLESVHQQYVAWSDRLSRRIGFHRAGIENGMAVVDLRIHKLGVDWRGRIQRHEKI